MLQPEQQSNPLDSSKNNFLNTNASHYVKAQESYEQFNASNGTRSTDFFIAKVINLNCPENQHETKESNKNKSDIYPTHELLFVEQNDVVFIEQRLDDDWFLARIDQLNGLLASKSCQILDQQIPLSLCQYLIDNKFYNLHICFASFVAQDVGDLSITKGDIIVANNQVNEHWLQGQVCYDNQMGTWPILSVSQQVGTFPLNHCWQLDSGAVKAFCRNKIESKQPPPKLNPLAPLSKPPPFIGMITHSSSLSSASSSAQSSSDYNNQNNHNFSKVPPGRPEQLPRRFESQLSMSDRLNTLPATQQQQIVKQNSIILTSRHQDKLKGWLHTVKKKTARLSTRITASLGLISLTRDEEFERHYQNFKHIEKTIKTFIKNLGLFVEHFESFLIALQNTSEHLSDFYRDKAHHKELEELRKKNKALNCEHFHAFKRTIDRQVIAVSNQLLQKFSGPHQLVSKRSAKLLDYDTRTKELESCRDLSKKPALRDQYVIAKDIYDRINRQLIEELPIFNQLAIEVFRECILVLLDGRTNLIHSYTKQTECLLNLPLMMTYTASDVASSILMSCELTKPNFKVSASTIKADESSDKSRKDSGQASDHDTRHNSANEYELSRPQSSASQLSKEFDRIAIDDAREISSTPLSKSNLRPSTPAPDEQENRYDGDIKEVEGHIHEPHSKTLPQCSNSFLTKSVDELDLSARKESHSSREEKTKRKKRKFQIYVASWPFVATGPNQLSITCKQPLKLIKGCDECGNSDWSLVQDKKGQLGYVPSSYIKKKE